MPLIHSGDGGHPGVTDAGNPVSLPQDRPPCLGDLNRVEVVGAGQRTGESL
jgi:hypothetical protein